MVLNKISESGIIFEKLFAMQPSRTLNFIQSEKCHSDDVRSLVALSETDFASSSRDGQIKIWRCNLGALEQIWDSPNQFSFINCLSLCADQLYFGLSDGRMGSLEVKSRVFRECKKVHSENVSSISCSAEFVLTTSWDTTATIRASSGSVKRLLGHNASILSSTIIGKDFCVTASADKTIKIWRGGECTKTLTAHKSCVRSVASFNDSDTMLSADNDGAIMGWHLPSFELAFVVSKAHSSFIYSIAFVDNSTFVTTGEDHFIKVWQYSSKECHCLAAYPLPFITNWTSVYIESIKCILVASLNGYISMLSFDSQNSSIGHTVIEGRNINVGDFDIKIESTDFSHPNLLPGTVALSGSQSLFGV